MLGGVYALFALGFTLIFGIHRIMNMAHGAVFMAGAFIGLYTVVVSNSKGSRTSRPASLVADQVLPAVAHAHAIGRNRRR